MRTSNVNTIKYYTVWELMLKIKSKHRNLLDFVSSSSFCLENDKLSWNSYWHINSSYKCIHIFSLQSRKLRQSQPDWRSVLCSCMGFASLNVPPWLLSKNSYNALRVFQSNRILAMSMFSPVILNGYKFTDWDVLKEVITRFIKTANISRTSFDRDKSFQINLVYRIQIEKRVN